MSSFCRCHQTDAGFLEVICKDSVAHADFFKDGAVQKIYTTRENTYFSFKEMWNHIFCVFALDFKKSPILLWQSNIWVG